MQYICRVSMKQLLFFVVAGFTLAACNNSTEKAPEDVAALMKDSTKFTTIQWIDTAIDFGTKTMGELVNITFRCKNTGDKPLYLFDVRPSCGCTVATRFLLISTYSLLSSMIIERRPSSVAAAAVVPEPLTLALSGEAEAPPEPARLDRPQ